MTYVFGLVSVRSGRSLRKKTFNLEHFLGLAAVWELAGGASDGCAPLNRLRRKSRAFVSAVQWFAHDGGRPCAAPILNLIFIATMIGSQEAKYKGARRWTVPRIPVPIRATVAL
jgi:hypothetical protein